MPRMTCLNKRVPSKNNSGPPMILSDALAATCPCGCASSTSSPTADTTMPSNRQMQVGVGDAREPAAFLGMDDLLRARFDTEMEIDPPHRDTADQADHEGRNRHRRP